MGRYNCNCLCIFVKQQDWNWMKSAFRRFDGVTKENAGSRRGIYTNAVSLSHTHTYTHAHACNYCKVSLNEGS